MISPPAYAQTCPLTALHLLSGYTLRPDGLAAILRTLGWDCSDIDIVNSGVPGEDAASHDLRRASLWDQIQNDMRQGQYQAIFMGTPCETASKARTGPPGPRPLRSVEHIYGLPKAQLTTAEHEQVKAGTYFALQSAIVARLATERGIPWLIENPDPSGNPVSLFNLPEWKQLAELPGVVTTDFHQCPMGAETSKPTRIISKGLDLSNLRGSCNHPKRHWEYTDHRRRKRSVFARHPPLAGRLRDDGSMATKAAAAYPSEMNKRLAASITQSILPL